MKTASALLLCVLMSASVALAIDNTGFDPDAWQESQPQAMRECSVYMYGDAMSEAARLGTLGFMVTVGMDLSYANISNYDVVMLPLVAPGSIGAYQADIQQFVGGGGGLFIHQPNAIGQLVYAPAGFEFYVSDNWWCEPEDLNSIVDPSHPTMAGLGIADLAGRFDTVPVATLGGGYTLVAEGSGQCTGQMCCAAGCYGEGRVFADVSNLSYGSGDPGSDLYVTNVIEWLCEGGPTPADGTTWGAIKSVFAK